MYVDGNSQASTGHKELEMFYNDTKVNCTTTYKYLGTHIDQHLNLSEHTKIQEGFIETSVTQKTASVTNP